MHFKKKSTTLRFALLAVAFMVLAILVENVRSEAESEAESLRPIPLLKVEWPDLASFVTKLYQIWWQDPLNLITLVEGAEIPKAQKAAIDEEERAQRSAEFHAETTEEKTAASDENGMKRLFFFLDCEKF